MGKKAGDDFFRFANGAWLDRVQIPAFGVKPEEKLFVHPKERVRIW